MTRVTEFGPVTRDTVSTPQILEKHVGATGCRLRLHFQFLGARNDRQAQRVGYRKNIRHFRRDIFFFTGRFILEWLAFDVIPDVLPLETATNQKPAAINTPTLLYDSGIPKNMKIWRKSQNEKTKRLGQFARTRPANRYCMKAVCSVPGRQHKSPS